MSSIFDNPVLQRVLQRERARREQVRSLAKREEQTDEEKQRMAAVEMQHQSERVREAVQSCAYWLRNSTATFNEHWVEEGRDKPNEPFPDWYFFDPIIEVFDREKESGIEKSRDMMASWLVVGYFTYQAMTVPSRSIVFQTLEITKAEQLIEYAKHLYLNQPTWLRDAFPLPKPAFKQAANTLEFSNGSTIFGIPGGKGKIRSYHPWGYFSDESAFQPEFLSCWDEAKGAGCKKLIAASSANIGPYSDWRKDVRV